jgi:hypothetical protein
MKLVVISLTFLMLVFFYREFQRKKQLAFIKNYRFHHSIKNKLASHYPHLTDEQIHAVFSALRDYFWICHKAKRKFVSMPSQIVDHAWHEFILNTRTYNHFCKKAIGHFIHHSPAETMPSPTIAKEGIKLTWQLACQKENINAIKPLRMPLIFAIDAKLNIENGFYYSLNCKELKSSTNTGTVYCAGDIGCSASSANWSDSFFDSSDSGCGSSCGGGCGGD